MIVKGKRFAAIVVSEHEHVFFLFSFLACFSLGQKIKAVSSIVNCISI